MRSILRPGLVLQIRALLALANKAGHRGSDRQPLGNRSGDKIEEASVVDSFS